MDVQEETYGCVVCDCTLVKPSTGLRAFFFFFLVLVNCYRFL